MSVAEIIPHTFETDNCQPESQPPLPHFPDTLLDFRPETKESFERINGHSIWRDVAEIGINSVTAREYPIVTALPKQQKIDQPVLITTAWQTSTRGHNLHTVLRLLELGFPVVMIGAEGEARSTKSRLVQATQAISTSLPLSAHNAVQAFEGAANLHNSASYCTFDDKNIIILGESRGAMLGMGLPYYAKLDGLRVIYGDLTAPCFAEAMDYRPDSLVQMAKQSWAEFSAIRGLAKTLGLKRFLHYPSTVNINPAYQFQALSYIGSLLNGDAGKMAWAIPVDTPLHIKTFDSDFMSQTEAWKRIFANRPEVVIKQVDGAHLSLASRETLGHIEARLTSLRDQLVTTGGNIDDLDFWQIHLTDRDNLDFLITTQ